MSKRKLPTPTHPGSWFSHRPTKAEKLNCWRDWHIGIAPDRAAAFACAPLGKPAEAETWNTARDHIAFARNSLENARAVADELGRMRKPSAHDTRNVAAYIRDELAMADEQLARALSCAALEAAAVDALEEVQG